MPLWIEKDEGIGVNRKASSHTLLIEVGVEVGCEVVCRQNRKSMQNKAAYIAHCVCRITSSINRRGSAKPLTDVGRLLD